MAHDVFISYSHKDQAIADGVCEHLESAGLNCWIAHRNVLPGDGWAKAIMKAIEGCKVMVLLFSESAASSEQIVRELTNAADSGVVIIPFRIDATILKDAFAYYLKTTNWLSADLPLSAKQLTALSTRIKSLVGVTAPGPADESAPPPILQAPLPPSNFTQSEFVERTAAARFDSAIPKAASGLSGREVYISYADPDRAIAERVCNFLETQGLRCWMAPRDVIPGVDWSTSVSQAIRECSVMVLVLSESSGKSSWVKHEVLGMHSKSIIGFRIDTSPFPEAFSQMIPKPPLGIIYNNPHWVDGTKPGIRYQLKVLASKVKAMLDSLPDKA